MARSTPSPALLLSLSSVLLPVGAGGCATTGSPSSELTATVPEAWRATVSAPRAGRPAEPRRGLRPAEPSSTLPGGITCLLRLQRLGVSHRAAQSLPHVLTPVELTGELAGVRWVRLGRPSAPLLCDCRLALALHRAGPALRALGVEEMLYSNSYRRPGRGRRLSRHAMGLAIDVHKLRIRGQLHDVREDFARGGGCIETTPINAVSCALAELRLFDRILSPDTDDDHQDHFHLAILSLELRRLPHRRRPAAVITD